MVRFILLFNNIKIVFRAKQCQTLKHAHEEFPDLLFVAPASFKLAYLGSFIMFHLLPC